jgi:hypothetical protein
MTYTNALEVATVEYTEGLEIVNESSLVEGIFYNANDRTAVFDLNDRLYKYSNVGRFDVAKVATAQSAGSEYQMFKRRFGPSESLGEYDDVEWKKVDTRLSVASNAITSNNVITTNHTSLNVPSSPVYSNFKVGFVVGNQTVMKYHNLMAVNVLDAAAKVKELGLMLDLAFKVKEVTVYFD